MVRRPNDSDSFSLYIEESLNALRHRLSETWPLCVLGGLVLREVLVWVVRSCVLTRLVRSSRDEFALWFRFCHRQVP